MPFKTRLFFLSLFMLTLCACHKHNSHPQPGYIVQVSMGSFDHANYTTADVIARLEEVSAIIPLEKVLIGWCLDPEPYREIGAYLHAKNIEMILYLPVFSETEELGTLPEAVDVWGEQPPFYGKGGFRFTCPSAPESTAALLAAYEQHLADVPFDGVFLDRIRTQSFVGGVSGVLNCGCERCAVRYQEYGVDLEKVKQAYEQLGDRFFDVSSYDPRQGFTFAHPLAADFFRAKGQIVSESVAQVADYFRDKGLIVGLDLYAPLMAQFVGQDYAYLAQHCDFIKPMLYRRTLAPAGISYEYDLLRQSIPNAQGYPDFDWDVTFLRGQLDALSNLPCAKYPGIEIVYDADIAPTDEAYILESLGEVISYGYEGAVVSWNIMQVPNAHIQCLNKLH